MTSFGPTLRAQRREQQMTLKQLAEKTNLSVSLLSEIERGLAQPSMASLNKIAHAMDISLFSFRNKQPQKNELRFSAARHSASPAYTSDIRVVRAGHRKKLVFPNNPAVYELLTPDLNRLLEVSYVAYETGFESGPEPIIDPPGERFIFVLSGVIEYRVAEEKIILNKGDSLYYPADAPMLFRIMGTETCKLIVVCTPPSF
jgi:transcriptional regulator with XRE-family HTH domain